MAAPYTVTANAPAYTNPPPGTFNGVQYGTQADLERAQASYQNAMKQYGVPTYVDVQPYGSAAPQASGSVSRSPSAPGSSVAGYLGKLQSSYGGAASPGVGMGTTAVDVPSSTRYRVGDTNASGAVRGPDISAVGGNDITSQTLAGLNQAIPGFSGLSGQASANILGLLSGKLPGDVQQLIQNSRAQQAVSSGMPGSSRLQGTLVGNATLRDLGLTSLQAQQ